MRNPLDVLRLPFGRGSTRRGRRPVRPRDPRRFVLAPAERPPPPRHVPWRRIVSTVAGLAAAGAVLYAAAWLVLGDPLRVQAIHVNGAEVANPRVVAAISGLGGDSMLTLDLEGAAERVESLAEVKEARLTRLWPHGVAIEVTEHQAWGYWQAAGRRAVIDDQGRVLKAARPAPRDAPTIVEIAPRSAEVEPDPDTVRLVARIRADRTLDALGVRPADFLFRRDRGLTVVVEDGPDAVFGDSSNYEFKVAAWAEILRRHGEEVAAATEIDLRFGGQVVLR